MQKKKLNLSALLIAGCFSSIPAQSKLFVHLKNGSSANYPLSSVRKLTFSPGTLHVVDKSGLSQDYVFSAVNYLNFQESKPLGLSLWNVEEASSILLHPNPVTSEVFVLGVELQTSSLVTVDIMNIDGTPIDQQIFKGRVGKNELQVKLNDQMVGIYLCRIKMGEKIVTKKIIKY
jgi:hypothetical protein